MEKKENNRRNFSEFHCMKDILALLIIAFCNDWSNQMDKLIAFAKSSYQRDFCLASLVIIYQVSCKKKRKSIEPFNGKVGQTHVTKICGSCPMLDGEILPSHL